MDHTLACTTNASLVTIRTFIQLASLRAKLVYITERVLNLRTRAKFKYDTLSVVRNHAQHFCQC